MRVSRTSTLTGQSHTMELPYTEDNFLKYLEGTPLAQAFPGITEEHKMFILEGITKEELLAKQAEEAAALAQAAEENTTETATEPTVEVTEDSSSKKKKSVNYR